ncbi:hypothetical protein PG999_004563 [Apiospora kogelbergensis]|uniref:Zn(2)-C6 fungal-type domain-containing protein n=1 Tax=Apiospora kogelbergensis TaxID=1337665 RepID=A0AAW0QZQ2_9PEZI
MSFRHIQPARSSNGDSVRCDGGRPKCGHCNNKRRTCGYRCIERKQQNTRLAILEAFVDRLKDLPAQQAGQLLQTWRDSHGQIASVQKLLDAAKDPLTSSSIQNPSACVTTRFAIQGTVQDAIHVQGHPAPLRTFRSQASTLFSPCSHTASSIGSPWRQASLWLPSPELTSRFVDRFFSSTANIFHVFSQEQMVQSCKAAFLPSKGNSLDHKATVCCLMIVAAVGAQYDNEVVGVEAQHILYDIARHHLEAVIQLRPVDAMKTYALLCMYNIMHKTTVAVAYLETGIETYERFRLHYKGSSYPGATEAPLVECRKAWRTLVFLSSWLSASLGNIPDERLLIESQLSDLEINTSASTTETIPNEMAKIALLKAKVMRMHLVSKELAPGSLLSIMEDLQTWYSKLPRQMRLVDVMRSEQDRSIRVSGCHVHLLHLGSIMLGYRRVAAEIKQSFTRESRHTAFSEQDISVLQGHCERAVVAAATSARIMDWLLKDNNVSKRCWLIVFQAYTSCVILLHYVAQKQAHAFVGRQWEKELTEAAYCLHVLKFCGSLDVAAAEFHKQLASIYSQLEKWRTDPEATIGDTVNLSTAEQSLPNFHSSYLLTTPHSADSDRALLSAVLLEMLHGPFSKRPTYNMVGRQDT